MSTKKNSKKVILSSSSDSSSDSSESYEYPKNAQKKLPTKKPAKKPIKLTDWALVDMISAEDTDNSSSDDDMFVEQAKKIRAKTQPKPKSKSTSKKVPKKNTNSKINIDMDTDDSDLTFDVESCDPFASHVPKYKKKSTKTLDDDDMDDGLARVQPTINEDDEIGEIENIIECRPNPNKHDSMEYHIKWVGVRKTQWIDESEFIQNELLNEFKSYENNRLNKNLQRRAYIYCRTSKRNADREVSLYDQEKFCLEFARKNKINIIGVFKDNGVSAKDMKNQRALNFVCNRLKKGELILFYDVSRFSRSTVQAVNRLQHLQENVGALAHSCHDGLTWNHVAQNRHNFRQNLSNAQLHSEVISEKVKSAIEFRRDRGDHIGRVPYGYKTELVNNCRKLVINQDEQVVINKIIDEGMNIFADRFGGLTVRDNKAVPKGSKIVKRGNSKISSASSKNSAAKQRFQSKKSEFTPKEYRKIADVINAKYSNRGGKPFTWNAIKKIIQNWN